LAADYDVVVDRDVCIGSGMCVVYAPESFDQDAEAKSLFRADSPDPLTVIQEAADSCPMGAITVVTRTA
jgi:ferredoxin